MVWEEQLLRWTKPASDNEDDKRARTERQICDAIRAHPRLSRQPLRVYAKGSYANNTNVRLDSDVDIAVEYTGGFYYDGVGDSDDQRTVTKAMAHITEYAGPYAQFSMFKDDVEEALRDVFGSAVSRENKCITIREGATTLPADVVPCWAYRYFYRSLFGAAYHEGTCLFPDRSWDRIVNYPKQHYDNGVAKNNRTSTRYKKTVRALKRLENDMVENGAIQEVPSYLIECVVYAAPDRAFASDNFLSIAREVLAHGFHATKGPEQTDEANRMLEVNEIKFLFHPEQKWTRAQANGFTLTAWNHLGLGS
jgi:predicted nucleotidyltransferase